MDNIEESKQILIAITDLQANVRNLTDQIKELSKISSLVLETDQRAKSAHNRIDDLKTEFNEKLQGQKEDYEKQVADLEKRLEKTENTLTWVWRSIGGSAIITAFSVLLFFLTEARK